MFVLSEQQKRDNGGVYLCMHDLDLKVLISSLEGYMARDEILNVHAQTMRECFILLMERLNAGNADSLHG
jgi:hypothetical protein